MPDKREIRGKLIGTDPMTDIALLKINVTGLPVVPWGDSSQLKVGEWVLAIGSPYQLNQTVTAGIVSATGRQGLGFADYEDFIQTDAAINRGNSGGALINSRGQLVGINTGIFSESGGYQGIGFAVPSNLARHVVDDLMKYGEVRRGSIGYLGDREADARSGRRARHQGHEGRAGVADEPRHRSLRGRHPARRRHRRVQRSDGGRPIPALARRGGRENRIDRHAEGDPQREDDRCENSRRLDRAPPVIGDSSQV